MSQGDSSLGQKIITGFFMICALVLTAAAVKREFFVGRRAPPLAVERAPVRVDNWSSVAGEGHRSGPETAAVTIVEFSDYECPACRKFNVEVAPMVRRLYPNTVAIIYRHWPLSRHRFSYPAARAVECAATQGGFDRMNELLYLKQDSLGLKTFASFAKEAGVTDLGAFDLCNAKPGVVDVIERDRILAERLGGRGTPTIVINGYLMRDRVDSVRVDSIVRAAVQN